MAVGLRQPLRASADGWESGKRIGTLALKDFTLHSALGPIAISPQSPRLLACVAVSMNIGPLVSRAQRPSARRVSVSRKRQPLAAYRFGGLECMLLGPGEGGLMSMIG